MYSVLFELCWLKGSCLSFMIWFLLCFFFLVLFVCSQNNEVVVLCVSVVCFCGKTTWFYCLHLVVLFPLLLYCFEFLLLVFSFLSRDQKRTQQKPEIPKMQKETDIFFQWAQLSSQIMFLFGGGLKMHFSENAIKTMLRHILKRENGPKMSKRLSQNLVQACSAT